jgi:hypothetical protein
MTYIILSLGLTTQAQNLVPNGDFEIYSQCPNFISQIIRATGWINGATKTTPDYFNSCSSYSTGVNMPYTTAGYQNDFLGGNAYAGIYTFNKGFPNDAREYIQIKLTDTLMPGTKYLISMYVNNSDAFDYCVATLGMYLTTGPIQAPSNLGFINVPNPQVKHSSTIKDTISWTLVQDTMIGNGELYLTIGNFSYDSLSDTLKITGNGMFYGATYNFIDGVSIYDVTLGSCHSYWDAGTDKYIMQGDSIRLGAINTDTSIYVWINSIGGTTFLSSNTDARPWASPTVTTTYYVTKTCPNNNVFNDTVTVYVQPNIGIHEQNGKSSQFNLYPNPNNGSMTLDYKIPHNASLEITDLNSRLLGKYFLSLGASKIEITNDNLQNGIYLYRVVSKNSILKTGKIAVIK